MAMIFFLRWASLIQKTKALILVIELKVKFREG